MFESLLAACASLTTVVKHMTDTTDSNTFPPETNKMTGVGMIRRKKMWIVCDGRGKMYCYHIQTPSDTIRALAKLKNEGMLTEEEFSQSKARVLRQLDTDSEEETRDGGSPT